MFDGLSRRELIGWAVCLVLAVGLTLFGSAFLAVSFMSADVSDVLKSSDGTKQAPPPLRSR
jgi:cell division protein FtsX